MNFYRRDGTPYPPGHVGLLEWARDCQKVTLKRVSFDKLPNGIEVSTVWLGLDHNYGFNNRPLIFETMLFVPCHKKILGHEFYREQIGDTWRYSTEEEALRGHKMQVSNGQSLRLPIRY